jgi:alpha-mannosidase
MKKVPLIGTSHIDPAWLWEWQDGYSEVLATFRSALDRMKEFPEMRYTASSAAFFGLVKEADPEMLEEIRERIREGRFEIVGGWLVESDCNMPSAEGFARQSLIGQRMFERLLGVKARTGYCPDSFGHLATMPKILRESEMDSYVFMRPKPHECELPSNVFRWCADDGSEVTTYRVHLNYGYTKLLHGLERIEQLCDMAEATGVPHMAFIGVSNHGGGPTNEFLQAIKDQNYDFAEFSSVSEYFDTVSGYTTLPTYKGELQHHAIGCYSANTEFKKLITECEHALTEAEVLALISSRIAGLDYPKEKLEGAWKTLLFNHFHDLIAGCSVKGVYRTATRQLGAVLSACDSISVGAMQKIAQSIDTACDGVYKKDPRRWFVWESERCGMPVVVFNSKPYPVQSSVKLFMSASRVTDSDGADIPFQRVRGEHTLEGRKEITVISVDLPPYSYTVYRVFQEAEPTVTFAPVCFDGETLENDKLAVRFDTELGEIVSVYDKTAERYVASSVFGTRVLDETDADTWAHGKETLGRDIGAFTGAEITVIEQGDVLTTVRVRQHYGESALTRDYTLRRGSDILSVDGFTEFYEKHRAVKLKLPAEDSVTADIAFGTIGRSREGAEEPFGEWLSSGRLGFALKGSHGYDLSNGYFCPTVLRTCIYADHFTADGKDARDPRCEHMGLYRTDFSYAIFPTDSATESRIKCDIFNTPPRGICSSFHNGTLPECGSFFSSESTVPVSAIKMAEDSESAVIRFFELEGDAVSFRARIFDSELNVSLGAHAVSTLREDGKPLYFTENEK